MAESEDRTGPTLATLSSGASERSIELTDLLGACIDSLQFGEKHSAKAYRTLAASSGNQTAVEVIRKIRQWFESETVPSDANNPAFVMFNCDYIGPDTH